MLATLKILIGSFIAGLIITAIINLFKKHGFGWLNLLKNTFGALFLFSATVKGIDPTGLAIKMGEYFEELHMMFMEPYSQVFSIIMIVAEFLFGLALIFGWRNKLNLWLLVIMNVFFAFLTGFTTITGKVTDCGCFGDFIKQTPFESFIKDIILLIMLAGIIYGYKKIKPIFSDSKGLIVLLVVGFGFLYFNFANFYFDKPIVDFRPYAPGKNIIEQRVIIPDVLNKGYLFENLKTGETKRISVEETWDEYTSMKKDTMTWKFIDQDNIVLEKGVPAKIDNYSAYNKDGDDVSEELLAEEGYSIWVLSRHLEDSYESSWSKIHEIEKYAKENNIRMYAFTSTVFDESDKFKEKHNLDFPFYEADEVLIKTVIRANPGILIIKNATVVAKWHHKHIPTVSQLEQYIE